MKTRGSVCDVLLLQRIKGVLALFDKCHVFGKLIFGRWDFCSDQEKKRQTFELGCQRAEKEPRVCVSQAMRVACLSSGLQKLHGECTVWMHSYPIQDGLNLSLGV